MIPSLYEPFRKWSEKGSVWIISDTHFNDDDTHIMNPTWILPQEHIDILNSKIFKNDTLICLGDCGDLEWFQKLKAGRKVLIKGNHDDRGNSYYQKKITKRIYDKDKISKSDLINELEKEFPNYSFIINESYAFHSPFERWNVTIDNNLFDEVYDGALFISDRILLSHEPIYGLPFCLNIHGHIHNGEYEYLDSMNGMHINLASDVANWQPFNLGKEIRNGLLATIPTIHRITIDKAIDNPVHKKEI